MRFFLASKHLAPILLLIVNALGDEPQGKRELPVPLTFESLKHEQRRLIAPSAATVPDRIRALAGRRVTIVGYAQSAMDYRDQILLRVTDFISTRKSETPLADEYVLVSYQGNWEQAYITRRLTVTGRFVIDDYQDKDTGEVLLIYRIVEATLAPADDERSKH